MTRNRDREEKYHWIGEIAPMHVNLYGNKSERDNLPKTLEEAKNYRIGTRKSSVVNDYLKEQGFKNLIEVKNAGRYMTLHKRNRFDLFPFIETSIIQAAQRDNFDPSLFTAILPLPDLSRSLWIVTNLSMPKEKVKKLREAYLRLKENGSLELIIKKHNQSSN